MIYMEGMCGDKLLTVAVADHLTYLANLLESCMNKEIGSLGDQLSHQLTVDL